ncbi:alkaline phosphatase D family protein [Aureivirga sp. CE67]|uniref:alkaline phosphatase D family protein n=1 Tax=Aureivirga sp. CE67 TaxID=1788983 RepID=UPI0018CA60A6|nr:alkaline phosphatase D family protein [Aureivirga sp. CE67]
MKTKNTTTRRSFLKNTLLASGGIILASNFISCSDDDLDDNTVPDNSTIDKFNHGVASFDPTINQVIIWTRYSTDAPEVSIFWEVSKNMDFTQVIRSGNFITNAQRDYTISIEVQDLEPNQKLYYRFAQLEEETGSVIGETITLAENPNEVKLAVCSCSNYAAGYFNVYDAMANSDADVIVHLGDYIYEYGEGEYGNTSEVERELSPLHEIITLDDYRERYRLYRSDKMLQLAHQKKPFICVWDDHEIANDTYKDGAQNHDSSEGSFTTRKASAIKAFSEYLPVKTEDNNLIYRNIEFGNLVNLIMLDTRVIGRDKQLSYGDFISISGFDNEGFKDIWLDPTRTILGQEQKSWLLNLAKSNSATWQVLGQQVLMAKMLLPFDFLNLLEEFSEEERKGNITTQKRIALEQKMKEFIELQRRFEVNDPTLTTVQRASVSEGFPYNLDAWDGYPKERDVVLNAFQGKKLVTLAGDTHNAWHSDLKLNNYGKVGEEFATTSVTSPGVDLVLKGNILSSIFEAFMKSMIKDLNYVNASDRGFMKVIFTHGSANAEWIFVDNIYSEDYQISIEQTTSYSG